MKFRIILLTALLSFLLIYSVGWAQDQAPTPTAEPASQDHATMGDMGSMSMATPECDIQSFVLQQQAYANALANLEAIYQADPETALITVYNAGQTYQDFALSCGFVPSEAANHGHDEAADEHSDEAHMALAMALGDPDRGAELFNTLQPTTGFACSTCHRVDSTETLIGPGLLNVGNPGHDPSSHEHGASTAEATETPHTERSMDEVVTYIRTSILHPSDYVVPGFPDLLMPQTYGQLLSEQDVNDLIAYLITLPQ